MKQVLILFFIFAVISSASALAIETDKNSYEKGETILISGEADAEVNLSIYRENIELYSSIIVPENGTAFSFDYATGFKAPSGEWKIIAESNGEKAEKKVNVELAGKSAYLLVIFYSPSEGEHKRGKGLEVNIELTDAGDAISGAEVLLYASSGESYPMKQTGLGRYESELLLPFDAEPGNFEITVAAEFGKGENVMGGENTVVLEVIETEILMGVIRPVSQSIPLGASEIILKPYYFGGNQVEPKTTITAKAEEQEIVFERQPNGEYAAVIAPSGSGDMLVAINAVDSAGNKGSKTISLAVGSFFDYFLSAYWPVLLVFAAIILFALFKAQSSFLHGARISSLEKKRNACKLRLKKTQEQYYVKGAINKSSFEAVSSECKRELSELNEKLVVMKAKSKKGVKTK